MSAEKFVEIAHSGQDITVERIKAYKEKGILCLYMTKADFRSYIKFNVELLSDQDDDSEV